MDFRDLEAYQPNDRAGPILQIGEDWQRAASEPAVSAVDEVGRETSVRDVVITQNSFDKPFVAVGSGGLPIERLFITFNTFGAYNSALELSGDPFNMQNKFRLDDSVIDHNVFKPGSKLDLLQKARHPRERARRRLPGRFQREHGRRCRDRLSPFTERCQRLAGGVLLELEQ